MTGATVARVCLDSPLPHLDRLFDYAIPDSLTVEVGSRVRVRLAGRLVSGIVVETAEDSDFDGTLQPIRSVSAIPSVTAAGIELAQRIAQRYGGSLWDVLRLMVPPRVAAVEKRDWQSAVAHAGPTPEAYQAAPAAISGDQARVAQDAASARISHGADPAPEQLDSALVAAGERIVWAATPDGSHRTIPAATLLDTALARIADGGSAILVVPDVRAIAAVLAECARRGLTRWTARHGGEVAVLDHDDGPSQRFGSYLAAMHGHARVVIGTRPVAMQPVPRLAFIGVWDEGTSSYEDPHAPYPHARTVAAMRADGPHAPAVVIGGFSLSADALALVEHDWATLRTDDRATIRQATPAFDMITAERRDAEGGSGWHWMPGSVWRDVIAALERGPVGIMVPRAGYVSAVACARCDTWSTCRHCQGPLTLPAPGVPPRCRDCAEDQPDWHCPECRGSALKHVRQGVERIVEQLTRMAPDVPVMASSKATGVLDDHMVTEGLVVATPAALPAVDGGYAHLVILDAGAPAGLALGGELHALRWWLSAAALVRSRTERGGANVVGHLPERVHLAMRGWDPAEAARDDYAERAGLGLPPHRRTVQIDGEPEDVDAALAAAHVPPDGNAAVTVIPLEHGVTLLVPRSRTQVVVDAARAQQVTASSERRQMRIRVDGPLTLPR